MKNQTLHTNIKPINKPINFKPKFEKPVNKPRNFEPIDLIETHWSVRDCSCRHNRRTFPSRNSRKRLRPRQSSGKTRTFRHVGRRRYHAPVEQELVWRVPSTFAKHHSELGPVAGGVIAGSEHANHAVAFVVPTHLETRVLLGINELEEHHVLVWTKRGRTVFKVSSYMMEWAMQSDGWFGF